MKAEISNVRSDRAAKLDNAGETATVTTTTKFVVAVHGIGSQTEFGTIKTAAFRFFSYRGAPANIPLGSFHCEKLDDALAPFLDVKLDDSNSTRLRFTEVYWAPVPRDIVKQGFTLEEATRWAQTIVERFRARYETKKNEYTKEGDGQPHLLQTTLTREDFSRIKQILLEIIESIRIIERLLMLAEKAGLFKFSLRSLLDDYVGDVQIVADFQKPRSEILSRFMTVMRAVYETDKKADIYLITHSEGTVVAFLGLLTAMSNDPADSEWVKNVKGLMTMGSPLDKHLLLWPELFKPFETPQSKAVIESMSGGDAGSDGNPRQRIQWKNYCDYGDPIGFNLETIRTWLHNSGWKEAFAFTDLDDHEFSRYPLPGKAHTDYWTDKAVFGHFIQKVMLLPADAIKGEQPKFGPPKTKPVARILSYLIPYLLFAGLAFGAIFLLRKAVLKSISPVDDPASALQVFRVVGLAALALCGLTAMAGIFRLTRMLRWSVYAIILFALTAAAFWWFHWRDSEAGHLVNSVFGSRAGVSFADSRLIALIVVTLSIPLVLLSNWVIKMRPTWGLRPFLVLLGAPVAALIAIIVKTSPYRESLWPLLLSGAAATYLWWLSALVFDLLFIWHYYIRHEAAVNRIREPTITNPTRKVIREASQRSTQN